MKIEFIETLDAQLEKTLDDEFNKYGLQNDIECNYTTFNFIAKNSNGDVLGILTGYTIYKEVHIDDLIVISEYRNKGIGTQLVKKVYNYFKDKNFNNINLVTNAFQAPEFYKKLGFKLEFTRINTENPKLTKHFFIKHFNKDKF